MPYIADPEEADDDDFPEPNYDETIPRDDENVEHDDEYWGLHEQD